MAYIPTNPNGSTTSSNSSPVVIASDQAAVPVSGTVTANIGTVATLATAAKQDSLLTELQLKADLTETQPVSLASVPSHAVTNAGTFAVQNTAATPAGTNAIGSVTTLDTTATGTITAVSQNVALSLNSKSGVAIQISGTWVGTLQFEGTVDGSNWLVVNGVIAGTSTPGSTTSVNGIVRLTPSGLAQVRIASTGWTSGTANISIRASDAAGGTFLNQSLTAGTNIIGKVGIDQTTPGTTNLVAAVGEVANGAADSGNPQKIGGQARTTLPTAVTDGQRVNRTHDARGRGLVSFQPRELVVIQTTAVAVTTADQVILAAEAAVFRDISSLTITNSSATACAVTLKDAVAGTTRAIYNIAANGGIVLNFNVPMPQAVVNTAWCVTQSAAVSLNYSVVAIKN